MGHSEAEPLSGENIGGFGFPGSELLRLWLEQPPASQMSFQFGPDVSGLLVLLLLSDSADRSSLHSNMAALSEISGMRRWMG